MKRENYFVGEDEQPPMCGEAVFSKLRPKTRDNKKDDSKRGTIRSFDQRPLSSTTSSETSADEDPVTLSPETALLTERSRSRRGKKFSMFKKTFMNPISEESAYENEDVLISEFFMDGPKIGNTPDKTSAVEFNSNNLNMLRSKHIRSKPGTTNTSKPGMPMNTSQPGMPMPTKSSLKQPISSNASSHSAKGEARKVTETSKNQDVTNSGAVLSLKDVLAQQQETLKIMAEQNQYYRKKLGDAQSSYRKLYKNKMNQADIIEKLSLEKASFEAETMLLREEMNAVRKQLDNFQKALEQQSKPTIATDNFQKTLEQQSKPTTVTSTTGEQGRQSSKPVISTSEVPAQKDIQDDFALLSSGSSHTEDLERATNEKPAMEEQDPADPAQDYWKREWELSMMGGDEGGEESKGETNENSDPFFDFSKDARETSRAEFIRGVDPPEVTKPVEKKAQNATEYEQDMKYVNKLAKKYHMQGTSEREVMDDQKAFTMPQMGHEFDEAQVAVEEKEALVEIENMFEVDFVYKQRQEELARIKKVLDEADYPEPHGKEKAHRDQNKIDFHQGIRTENGYGHLVQHKQASEAWNHENSPRSQHSRVRFEKSTKQGSREALPDEFEDEQGGFPKLDRNHHSETRDENESYRSERSDCEPVRDQSYRSERSDYGPVRDQSYRSERSDYGPARDQSYRSERSDYGPVREQSYRSERSDYGPVRDQSLRSERSDYGSVREQSTRTDRSGYESRPSEDETEADHIDHSTSMHNALMWAHSGRSERSHAVRREVSVRSERSGYTSRPEASERSVRSGYSSDVMDGIVDTDRSEHTLAMIHEPSRQGRKGGTYKIKIASPHHSQPRGNQSHAYQIRDFSERDERSTFSRKARSGQRPNALRC